MQNYAFETIKKDTNNSSVFGTSALWHCDRFVPSFKFIYFPTKVSVDPFEYALKSHIINNQYIKNIMLTLNMEKKYANKMENDFKQFRKNESLSNLSIINRAKEELSKLDMSGYTSKKFYCNENTLLLVCTHGLHRRSQSEKHEASGIRNNLTLSYYNQYTRLIC